MSQLNQDLAVEDEEVQEVSLPTGAENSCWQESKQVIGQEQQAAKCASAEDEEADAGCIEVNSLANEDRECGQQRCVRDNLRRACGLIEPRVHPDH